MKIAVVLLIVAAAFAGGYLLRSTCDVDSRSEPPPASPESVSDAEAALDELLRFTGEGPIATRKAIDLVDRVAAGGPQMLPALQRALTDSPAWDYHGNHTIDYQNGVFSGPPNRRIALLEAVTRIGGPRAIEMLIEAAEDRRVRGTFDLLAPIVFLARHAGDDSAREFFTAQARMLLVVMRKDRFMIDFLKVVRGRLSAELEPKLTGALAAGWASGGAGEGIAHCLIEIDAGRARAFFLTLLMDVEKPKPGRKVAAWALGRIPEARADALARILGELQDPELLQRFLAGIGRSRFGESSRYYGALESDDPTAFSRYLEDRKRDIDACRDLLRSVEERVGGPAAEKCGFPTLRDNFDRALAGFEEKLVLIEAAKTKPE